MSPLQLSFLLYSKLSVYNQQPAPALCRHSIYYPLTSLRVLLLLLFLYLLTLLLGQDGPASALDCDHRPTYLATEAGTPQRTFQTPPDTIPGLWAELQIDTKAGNNKGRLKFRPSPAHTSPVPYPWAYGYFY